MKVVFVGDEPSKHNTLETIPFVGTKSLKIIMEWIRVIKPDYYICLNSDTWFNRFQILMLQKTGFKILALGNKASERLKCDGVLHFKLPHPSGKNRKLNDRFYVARELQRAIWWMATGGKPEKLLVESVNGTKLE